MVPRARDACSMTNVFGGGRARRGTVAAPMKGEVMEKISFGEALSYLKHGGRVARQGWNGKGLWLELQRPDLDSKMTLPYIYINYPDDAINTPGARVPWLASQTDRLAEDWMLV
jgi:hypothetical protein